jgi:hypothetical protein
MVIRPQITAQQQTASQTTHACTEEQLTDMLNLIHGRLSSAETACLKHTPDLRQRLETVLADDEQKNRWEMAMQFLSRVDDMAAYETFVQLIERPFPNQDYKLFEHYTKMNAISGIAAMVARTKHDNIRSRASDYLRALSTPQKWEGMTWYYPLSTSVGNAERDRQRSYEYHAITARERMGFLCTIIPEPLRKANAKSPIIY